MKSEPVSYILGGLTTDSAVHPAEFLVGLLIFFVLTIVLILISISEKAILNKEKETEGKNNYQFASHDNNTRFLLAHIEKVLSILAGVKLFFRIVFAIFIFHFTQVLLDFRTKPGLLLLIAFISVVLILLDLLPRIVVPKLSGIPAKLISFISYFIKILYPLKLLINSYQAKWHNVMFRQSRKNIIEEDLVDAKEIFKGISKFGEKRVNEIMHPRPEMTCLDVHDNFEEVLQTIRGAGYSRIPVYNQTVDDIRGILYIKDLLQHIDKGKSFHWQSLMHQPYFVPDSKRIDSLLEEFQKTQVHLAIVIDEYGGTSGLVTLEDILEEIVGNISDEFDKENPNFIQVAKNEFIFAGSVLLNDFYKATDIDERSFDEIKGEAETLAGLILEIKKEMPQLHDELKVKNFIFKIEDVDLRKINKIRLIITSSVKRV